MKLFEKNIFKVVISDKIVMFEKLLTSIQVLNVRFVDNLKDLYNDKAYEKSCLVMHTFNDEKKNLILMHLLKILKVS